MLSGDNGILQKATDAKIQTGIGQEKEIVALAYNSALAKKVSNGNSNAVTDSELNDELDSSEATASGSPIIVTFIKSGNAYEIDSNGIIKPSTPKDPNASNLTTVELSAIEANNTANPTDQIEEITSSVTNTNLQDTTKIKAVLTGDVPIPVGANYMLGTVDTGVVIKYKNSEFVWIPVPVTAENDLYVKGTTKPMARVTSGTDENGKTNYQGVLYNYSGTTSTEKTSYGQGTTSNREPDIVSSYDNDTAKPSGSDATYLESIGFTQSTFQTAIQQEYNKMIESVSKYGGFFVGRYETSYNITTNKVESIADVIPAHARDTNTNMWYGLYKKQQQFTESTDKMVSSMIWGSQYDAMLNWALEGADKSHVTATSNATHNSTYDATTIKTRTTTETIDSITAVDKINNIYDLEGNQKEWTQEAYNQNYGRYRVLRGGCFSSSYNPSYRYSDTPNKTNSSNGSRLSLYIK